MHIFSRHWQIVEVRQNMPTDFSQYRGLIGADIENLLIFFRCKGIKANGKNRQFSGAAGRFKQTVRVGVIAGGRIGVDISYPRHVVVIVRMTTIVTHILIFNPFIIQLAQDLLRGMPKIDTQMIDQLQFALLVNTGKERHLGIGRAALHQRAAGVITDAADDRRADTRRTNHRVRFTAQRFKRFFQRIERRTGPGQNLLAVIQ